MSGKKGEAEQENILMKLRPALKLLEDGFDKAEPYLEKCMAMLAAGWGKLQPYHPEEFGPCLLGLFLAFMGGNFCTTIAAVEAFRIIGFDSTKENLQILYKDFKKVREASLKDDKVDADKDGVADVLQISNKDLATRKLALFLRTTDPERVAAALCAVNAGLLAVIATLRVKFALAASLGSSIGSVASRFAYKYAEPPLKKVVQSDYQKWIRPTLRYVCMTVGVALAWKIQQVISAFHSSIRGGDLFALGLIEYLRRNNKMSGLFEKDTMSLLLAYGVAILGFMWQYNNSFSLPFPLNILLLPASIFEWMLTYVVADSSLFNA